MRKIFPWVAIVVMQDENVREHGEIELRGFGAKSRHEIPRHFHENETKNRKFHQPWCNWQDSAKSNVKEALQ
jgi:hypothetical protein